MHFILEGALARNCSRLLHHCIYQRKYFSLNNLNKVILTFKYGEHEKVNSPRPIDRDRIVNVSDKLGQSGLFEVYLSLSVMINFIIASQMWLLGRLLPLMVGDFVPDDDPHWLCFVDLLRILCIVTAAEDAIGLLSFLTESYLFQYNTLYPDSVTYKLHILLHLSDQIRR